MNDSSKMKLVVAVVLKTKDKALKFKVITSIKIAWQKVIDLIKLIYISNYKFLFGLFKDRSDCVKVIKFMFH